MHLLRKPERQWRLAVGGRQVVQWCKGATGWLQSRFEAYIALGAMFVCAQQCLGGDSHKISFENLPLLANNVKTIDISSTGKWIAVETSSNVEIVDSGSGLRLNSLGEGTAPIWSPAGTELAFLSSRSGDLQLWVWNSTDRRLTRVTHFEGGIDADPVTRIAGYVSDSLPISWSPEGSRIVFASRVPAARKQTMGADGDSEGRTDNSPPGPLVLTNSTPAARTLSGIFVEPTGASGVPEARDGRSFRLRHAYAGDDLVSQLFIVDRQTGAIIQITHDRRSSFHPAWSPDGLSIAYAATVQDALQWNTGAGEIVLLNLQTGVEESLAGGEDVKFRPRWSPSGRAVAYLSSATILGWPSLNYVSLGASVPISRVPFEDRYIDNYAWTTDGKSFLIQYKDGTSVRIGRLTNDLRRMVDLTDRRKYPIAIYGFSESRTGVVAWSQYDPHELSTIQCVFLGSRQARVVARFNTVPHDVSFGDVQTVKWHNERGDELEGTVLLPPGYRHGQSYPLIVDAYPLIGGANWADPMTSNFAWSSSGYVVFRPSPRAPHVWMNPWKAQMSSAVAKGAGGWDLTVDDVLSGTNELIREGIVDRSRMCLYGWSNGGGVVDFLITRTNRFVCAVSVAPALSDWLRPWLFNIKLDATIVGVAPDIEIQEYIALSAVFHLRSVSTPLLLAGGDADVDFLLDAIEMYNGLRRLGKTVTLLRYPRQHHAFTESAMADFWSREMSFFAQYLRADIPHRSTDQTRAAEVGSPGDR